MEQVKKAWGPPCQCGCRKGRHRKRHGEQGRPRKGDCLDCGAAKCPHFRPVVVKMTGALVVP